MTNIPKIVIDITPLDTSDDYMRKSEELIIEYLADYHAFCDKFYLLPHLFKYKVTFLARAFDQMCLSSMSDTMEPLDEFENRFVTFTAEREKLTQFPHDDTTGKIWTGSSVIHISNKEVVCSSGKALQTYDMNSMYGYALQMPSLRWVFDHGTFEQWTQDDVENKSMYNNAYYFLKTETLPYFYPQKLKNHFRWWTNFDVLIFKLFDIKFEIDITTSDNAYVYKSIESKDFRKVINQLYDYRKATKSKIAKQVIQQMHSVLIEKVKEVGDVVDATKHKEDDLIYDLQFNDDGELIHEAKLKKKNAFTPKFNMIRMQPFIYGSVRYQLCRKLLSPLHKNNIQVYRVYVDSVVCEENEIMNNLLGSRIGDLKLEDKPWNGRSTGKFISRLVEGGFISN